MAYWVSCGTVSQQEVSIREGGIDLIYVLQGDQEVIEYEFMHLPI